MRGHATSDNDAIEKRQGFTLVELLVVISIIGLLSSVVVASLNSAREKGRVAAAQAFSNQVSRAIGANAVGIWDFEGVSGGSIEDRSGNGNTASVNGSATYVAGPVTGSTAISLFGDAYAQVTNSASLNPGTSDFTIMFWLRTTGYDAHGSFWNVPVGKADVFAASGLGIGFAYDSTNIPRFILNGLTDRAVATTAINDNRWHHIAGVRKGDAVAIYIDGREQGSGVIPSGLNLTTASHFYIGKDSNGIIRTIRGYLDNVIFAPSALTASEIGRIYAESASKHRFASW